MQARWMRLGRRSQPKTHRPRKVDSKKKAARPSMASGAPKTSPTKREYADQFMPNSNSCTMPVTTPMATLISSRVPKKRVRRLWSGLPVRCRLSARWPPASQSDGDGHEQEVVDAGSGELHPSQVVS